MRKSANRIVYEQRVYRVQDYISAHLDRKLNLSRLASISAISPFHFHRIFKSVAGETVYDFVQRLRLEKSCRMLSSDDSQKIIHIAFCCGFSTPSSFSKAFKQQYRMSPSEYRNRRNHTGTLKSKNGKPVGKAGKEKTFPVHYPITDVELESLYNRRKKMNVRIETLPEYRIAYMRRIGAYGEGNFQLMRELKKWAITRDLLNDSSVILGLAHDDPAVTPPQNCRYDTCIVIPDDYELEKNINESRLPGGKYAIIPVEHTAEAIGKIWNDIFTVWLPDSGYLIDDRPIFERYTGTAKETKLEPEKCEICIPVKKVL